MAGAWLALATIAGTGSAQSLPIVLEVPGSARAAAMGGAYYLDAPLADVLFLHPGAVSEARGAVAGYTDLGPNARAFTAAGAVEWWDGGVAVGVQTLSYGAASADPALLPPRQSALGSDAANPVSEQAVTVGYGRGVAGIDLGGSVRLADVRIGAARSGTVTFDVGAATDLGPVRVAASVQNLGEGFDFPAGSVDSGVRVGGGAATPLPSLGPLDFAAATSVYRMGDGAVDAGGGLEVRYWPLTGRTFAGRVGYRHVGEDTDAQGLTLGAGFFGDAIRLDYAWEQGGASGAVHRFGIGWR